MMDLPLICHFEGWHIRYNVLGHEPASIPNSPHKKYVAFVHGTPWSSIVYRPVVEALLARGNYQILIYDLPGYGQSQQLDPEPANTTTDGDFAGDTSVKFQARALAEMLKIVGFDGRKGRPKPAVIAHDIAGAIVLRAHLLHNCDFTSMLLADTNTVLPWGDGFYKLARAEPQAFLNLPPKIYEAVLRAVIQSAVHDPKVLLTGWEEALVQPWIDKQSGDASETQRQRSFIRQIAQANDTDVAEMLEPNMYERVRCNVKIVWGEQDQWIPKHKIEDLIKRLNGKAVDHAYIPNAGHLVMLDQPARFAIEVYDWLAKLG